MSHTYAACAACNAVNRISAERAPAAVCGKCGTALDLHGLVSAASETGFAAILRASDRPVVVDFWASWCGPCKSYGPEFERASVLNPGMVFLKVSTETEPALAARLGIRGIPCTVVFRDGKEIKRQAGAMSAEALGQLLREVC